MKISKILTFAVAIVFIFSGFAFAVPTTLYDILKADTSKDWTGTEKYTDTAAESVVLDDTDGNEDDVTAFLFLEIAGYKAKNAFGIYGFDYDASGNVVLVDDLEVFPGAAYANGPSVTLRFDLLNGKVTNQTTTQTATIGRNFGFYLDSPDRSGTRFYSHTELNPDGSDHMMIFDTGDNSVGYLNGSDVVIAMEDLFDDGTSDKDYNDMVVGVSDVSPVPEPATILLFGAGLLGLAAYGRKKGFRRS